MAYLKNKNTSIVIPNTPPIPEFGQEFSPDPTPYNGSHPERHAKPAAGFETPHARLRAYREELLNEQLQQPPTNDVPDASSKAKLEKRIRSYQVSLQQASNRHHVYNELFALAPVAYITLDARGTIQMVNLAATRLLGISQSILTNQAFYTLVAPEDRAQVRVHLDDASPSNASTNCEVTLLLPNDRKVDVMLATTGLRTKNDSANAYQIMLMDNSAHLHNEKLWRNAKDYMEELALHDPLTKLPNRYKFNTTLDNVIDSCKAKDTTLHPGLLR